MSASGTISNLQQALNCASKCDCCASLQSQINELKAKLANIKPVDEQRIIEATLLKVDPKIAAASVAISAAISAKFDPRIKEALEKAFGASNKAETIGEQQLRYQQESQARWREVENTAKAAKTKADAVEPIANKAQSDGARALRETEIAERLANEAKKEAANAKFTADRADNTAKTAKDIADIAARESALYKNLNDRTNARITTVEGIAKTADSKATTATTKIGALETTIETVRSSATKAGNVAQEALRKSGDALSGALEAIGLNRRIQSELAQQAVKIGSLALRVADLASLVIEVLVSVGLAEALGARVDAVERGQQQLSDDISRILGRWIPEIRGLARQAGLDASFARQLASSLSAGVSSALSQSSLALAGVREASANAIKAIAISAAVQVAVGTAINLATRALTGSQAATTLATQASTKADTALKNSNAWQSPVKALQERIGKLRNGIDGKPGKPGTQGLRGLQGIQGIQGRPGLAGKPGITTVVQLPGTPGRPGRDGIDGRDGINGINGRNGKDVNPADVAAIKAQLATIQAQNSVLQSQNNVMPSRIKTILGGADLGLLAVINTKLGALMPNGGISSFLKKFGDWSVLNQVLSIMTFATTVHNAAMLSNDIGQTLLGAIGNVLAVLGIKNSDGQAFDISTIIGNTVENFLKTIIGTDNYTALTTGWAKANRIYQATINIFNSLQNTLSTVLNALEITVGRIGKIGNALRQAGEVLENAYTWMNPQPKFNRITNSLEALQNGASTIQMVTQAPLDVINATTELTNATTEFGKAFKEDEKPENKGINDQEPEKLKTDKAAEKEASAGKELAELDLEADEEVA